MRQRKGRLCQILQGGVGNRFLQFSTVFAAAVYIEMDVVMPSNDHFRQVFEINVTFTNVCQFYKRLPKVLGKTSPTYDSTLLEFSSSNKIQYGYGLQSC